MFELSFGNRRYADAHLTMTRATSEPVLESTRLLSIVWSLTRGKINITLAGGIVEKRDDRMRTAPLVALSPYHAVTPHRVSGSTSTRIARHISW